jgi:hypothetical protein
MPKPVTERPDNGLDGGSDPLPAAEGWLDGAWNQVTAGAATLTIAVLAAVLTGVAVYFAMRRPSKADLGKRLMYAPLLLVNLAAIYGQLAFFYRHVAPTAWPVPGKIALAIVVALAIESIAVYVGWHAHDALINKLGRTAARLRRASYGIATLVAAINYAHFADFSEATGNELGLNAASVAFGLLSLISPWLWGLHSRRMKNLQLAKEGVADAVGATFSGERIRSFPIRSYLARRWSIDHYVTDPKQAWEGYNNELRQRWAIGDTDRPGWWLRINPTARVRQLTAAVTELRAITARQADDIAHRDDCITDVMQRLTAAHTELTDVTAQLDEATRERLTADDSLRAITARADSDRQALIAEHEKHLTDVTARLIAEKDEALANLTKDLTAEFTAKLAAAKLTNLVTYRNEHGKNGSSKPSKPTSQRASSATASKQLMTDEEAVQAMLSVHADPGHEWSDYAVRKTTGAGYGNRIPRLIAMWREAATKKTAGDSTGDDTGEPWAVAQ